MFNLYFLPYIINIIPIKDVFVIELYVLRIVSETVVDLNLNLSFRNEPDGLCFMQRDNCSLLPATKARSFAAIEVTNDV